MKHLFLFLIIFSSSIFAGNFFCYQSSANTSNQTGMDGDCGLLYTGNYNWSVDSLNGGLADFGSSVNLSLNYTKPPLAISTSIWTVAIGAGLNYVNLSIPSSCWNVDPNILQLRFHMNQINGMNGNASAQCFDGTNWNTLRITSGNSDTGALSAICYGTMGGNLTYDPYLWRDGLLTTGATKGVGLSGAIFPGVEAGLCDMFGPAVAIDFGVVDSSMIWDIFNSTNSLQILSPGNGTTFLNPFPVPINIQSITTVNSSCNAFLNGASIGSFNSSFSINQTGFPLIIGSNNISATCSYDIGPNQTVTGNFNYILPSLDGSPFKKAFDADISVCPLGTLNELSLKCLEYYKIPSVFNFSAVPCINLNISMNLSCLDPFRLTNVTKIGPFDNYTIFYTPAYWQYHGAIGVSNLSLQLTGAEFIYNSKFVTHGGGMELIDNDSFFYVPAQFKPVDCGYFFDSFWGRQCGYGYGFIVNNRIVAIADSDNQWYTAAATGVSNSSLVPPEPVIYVNVIPLPANAVNPFNGIYSRQVCNPQNGSYIVALKNSVPQTYTVFVTINNTGMINITSFSVQSTDLDANIPLISVINIKVFDSHGKICELGEDNNAFINLGNLFRTDGDGFSNLFLKIIMLFVFILSAILPYTLVIPIIFNDLYHVLSLGELSTMLAISVITGIGNNIYSPERGIKNMIVVMAVCISYLMLLYSYVAPYAPTQYNAATSLLSGLDQFSTAESLSDLVIGFISTTVALFGFVVTIPITSFNLIDSLLSSILPPTIMTPLHTIITFLGYGATFWFNLKAYEVLTNKFKGV